MCSLHATGLCKRPRLPSQLSRLDICSYSGATQSALALASTRSLQRLRGNPTCCRTLQLLLWQPNLSASPKEDEETLMMRNNTSGAMPSRALVSRMQVHEVSLLRPPFPLTPPLPGLPILHPLAHNPVCFLCIPLRCPIPLTLAWALSIHTLNHMTCPFTKAPRYLRLHLSVRHLIHPMNSTVPGQTQSLSHHGRQTLDTRPLSRLPQATLLLAFSIHCSLSTHDSSSGNTGLLSPCFAPSPLGTLSPHSVPHYSRQASDRLASLSPLLAPGNHATTCDSPVYTSGEPALGDLSRRGVVYVPTGAQWPDGFYACDIAKGFELLTPKDQRTKHAKTDLFSDVFPGVVFVAPTFYRNWKAW